MPEQRKKGANAPEFEAKTTNEKTIRLSDFKGKKRVVLYFYPKDDTPGCTTEACGFRDKLTEIETKGAVILGVSPDTIKSHQKFSEKFSLPFQLLADEDKTLCKAYGVWQKKSMYGKEYMGVARTTFIIGKNGKIEKIYKNVKPKIHDEEVLEFLSA